MNFITLELIAGLIIAYLLGSISTAIIVAKIARLPDPRQESSQNPGASNMLRIAGAKFAILTLIGDGLKGFIAVIIGLLLLHYNGMGLSLIAAASVVGHMYPIYFRFHGGKGVATTLGSLLALSPLLGVIVTITWFVVAGLSRYASLASLTCCIAAPFIALGTGYPAYFIGLTLIAILIIFRHRHNIKRLCHGTENRLFAKEEEDMTDQEPDKNE